MRCWEAVLPHVVRHPLITVDLAGLLKAYQRCYAGAMYSGCGGGYLIVAANEPVPGASPRHRPCRTTMKTICHNPMGAVGALPRSGTRRARGHDGDRRRAAPLAGAVRADAGLAGHLPLSGLVPRRQVRHLGPLGPAVRADGGRLVRPEHVHPGRRRQSVPASPGQLRSSLRQRLQGHHSAVEGREVGPRPVDGALQEGRRQVLRQHGRASRQLRPLELEVPPVERGQHGPAPGRRRRMAEGGPEAGPAVRRVRAPRRELHLVPDQPRERHQWSPRRRALRRRRPEVAGPLPPAGRSRATRPGTAPIPRWHQEWSARITDLVDQYQPDLLYTDGVTALRRDGPQAAGALLQRQSGRSTAGAWRRSTP